VVSSIIPDSEMRYCTLSNAAVNPAHAGAAYTGFAPCTTATSIFPAAMVSIRRWTSWNGATASKLSVRSKRTVSPMFPATWLSRLTAATSATDCSLWVATPPATARLGRLLAKRRASARTVSAGTSVCFSTASGS